MERTVHRKLDKKETEILRLFSLISVILLIGIFLHRLKYVVLASEDSMNEYALARQLGFVEMFKFTFDFCLKRGRVGIIFPLICTVRHYVNSTGNYTLIWLLQYVPVVAAIGYIASVINRRIGKAVSCLFLMITAVFLQTDTCHNLLVCYPLDFCAALFFSVASMDLFISGADGYFKNGIKSKTVIMLILSAICFYVSLESYESFIAATVPMFLIVLFKLSSSDGKIGSKIKDGAVLLALPFLVSVIYIVVWYILSQKIYSLVDEVYLTDKFSTKGFLMTWATFSTDLFPFRRYITYKALHNHTEWFGFAEFFIDPLNIIGAIVSLIGTFSVTRYVIKNIESLKSKTISIRLCACISFAFAVLFPLSHALLPRYQSWVVNDKVQGYVPSFICYLSWTLFIACILILIMLRADFSKKSITVIFAAALTVISVFGFAVTSLTSNQYIKALTIDSMKAQVFCMMSSEADFGDAQIVYTDSFDGLHGQLQNDTSLMDFESGTDVTLTNNPDDLGEGDLYFHVFDNGVGILTATDDDINPEGFIQLCPAVSGDYDIMLSGLDGTVVRETLELKRGEVYTYCVSDTNLIFSGVETGE